MAAAARVLQGMFGPNTVHILHPKAGAAVSGRVGLRGCGAAAARGPRRPSSQPGTPAALPLPTHPPARPLQRSTVVCFPGDRVLDPGLPERIARLQDPAQLAALLAAKFPAPQVYV